MFTFQWWLNFLMLPDEDTLLSHRLDVASDELTCLQCVYRHNFRVLRWFGLLWVQPEEQSYSQPHVMKHLPKAIGIIWKLYYQGTTCDLEMNRPTSVFHVGGIRMRYATSEFNLNLMS